MIQLIERILQWLRGGSLKLLILAGIILLVWGTLSPIGTLVWWLSQGSEILGFKKDEPKQLPPSNNSNPAKKARLNCYVIFLTGVGDFSTDELTEGEEIFLKGLERDHPECVVVGDVFPYSAANESLGGERLLAPLWSFANEAEGWLGIANVLIKVRNLWRFAISADERYGPVYNQGIASAIIDRMNAAHPIPQSRQPLKLILIGTSGGGQVALGATEYLNEWLDAQIIVVSVGGVFNGINGFDAANRVYHLWGSRDWVDNIGSIVFPSRWSLTFASPFNQALQQGDYEEIMTGYHEHDGAEGYFGEKVARANGIRYVDLTLQKVNQLPIWSFEMTTHN
jgi:hypothetical protein